MLKITKEDCVKSVKKMCEKLCKSCVSLSTQTRLVYKYNQLAVEKQAIIHKKYTPITQYFQQPEYNRLTLVNKIFIHNFHSIYYYIRTIKNLKGL